jgi:hypothetical protein
MADDTFRQEASNVIQFPVHTVAPFWDDWSEMAKFGPSFAALAGFAFRVRDQKIVEIHPDADGMSIDLHILLDRNRLSYRQAAINTGLPIDFLQAWHAAATQTE